MFHDVVTRAHVLTCLGEDRFWIEALRPNLPPACLLALKDVASHIAEHAELLAVLPEEAALICKLAA